MASTCTYAVMMLLLITLMTRSAAALTMTDGKPSISETWKPYNAHATDAWESVRGMLPDYEHVMHSSTSDTTSR